LNQTEIYSKLKRNPDNQFFVDLMTLLNFRLDTIKRQLIESTEDQETIRLQGRGKELSEMISALTRKPVDSTKMMTGGFN